MSKMRIGHVFNGQENKSTSKKGAKDGGKLALDGLACQASKNYNPNRDWLRVWILVLLLAFFMNAFIGSFVFRTSDGFFVWN